MKQQQFKKFATPKKDVVVYDPGNRNAKLPPEGAVVHGNRGYWTRRKIEGSVVLTDVPAKAPETETKPSTSAGAGKK